LGAGTGVGHDTSRGKERLKGKGKKEKGTEESSGKKKKSQGGSTQRMLKDEEKGRSESMKRAQRIDLSGEAGGGGR